LEGWHAIKLFGGSGVSASKPQALTHCFVWNLAFGHWDLFEICDLEFVIFSS
jgi:hypothetical protein